MDDKIIEDRVKFILLGIDLCEDDNYIGWWETTKGAEFGAMKQDQIIKLCKEISRKEKK